MLRLAPSRTVSELHLDHCRLDLEKQRQVGRLELHLACKKKQKKPRQLRSDEETRILTIFEPIEKIRQKECT